MFVNRTRVHKIAIKINWLPCEMSISDIIIALNFSLKELSSFVKFRGLVILNLNSWLGGGGSLNIFIYIRPFEIFWQSMRSVGHFGLAGPGLYVNLHQSEDNLIDFSLYIFLLLLLFSYLHFLRIQFNVQKSNYISKKSFFMVFIMKTFLWTLQFYVLLSKSIIQMLMRNFKNLE